MMAYTRTHTLRVLHKYVRLTVLYTTADVMLRIDYGIAMVYIKAHIINEGTLIQYCIIYCVLYEDT